MRDKVHTCVGKVIQRVSRRSRCALPEVFRRHRAYDNGVGYVRRAGPAEHIGRDLVNAELIEFAVRRCCLMGILDRLNVVQVDLPEADLRFLAENIEGILKSPRLAGLSECCLGKTLENTAALRSLS